MDLNSKKGLALNILIFACIGFMSAQSNWCGTIHTEEMDKRQIENLENMQNRLAERSGAPKYIPITFILVADDNGNGRLKEEKVLEQIANLNSFYADQEIVFYLDEFRYLDKSLAFNFPAGAGEISMSTKKDPNAISLFVCNTANSGDELPGVTTLAYYDGGRDWIVSRKADINGITGTIAHELGHFFSVSHPHAGWDCLPYTEEEYGNPVNLMNTKCNGVATNNVIELADGSNCVTAGDRICDTPADYNFQILHNGNAPCGSPTDIMDKNGDIVMPMFNNIMGYYLDCPDKIFTQSQKNLITSDYLGFSRAYIRTGVTPNTTPVTASVEYIYPENGGETEQFDNVTLDWEDTPGANKYMVTIDRFSSFTFNPQTFIIDESELNLTNLELDKTYFWKVWPYNESQTGHGWDATQSFKATISTSVPTIKEIESIAVYPNPLSTSEKLYVKMETNKALQIDIEMFDMQGRLVQNFGQYNVSSGEEKAIELNMVQVLSGGLYILKLTSENGTISHKISVQ